MHVCVIHACMVHWCTCVWWKSVRIAVRVCMHAFKHIVLLFITSSAIWTAACTVQTPKKDACTHACTRGRTHYTVAHVCVWA